MPFDYVLDIPDTKPPAEELTAEKIASAIGSDIQEAWASRPPGETEVDLSLSRLLTPSLSGAIENMQNPPSAYDIWAAVQKQLPPGFKVKPSGGRGAGNLHTLMYVGETPKVQPAAAPVDPVAAYRFSHPFAYIKPNLKAGVMESYPPRPAGYVVVDVDLSTGLEFVVAAAPNQDAAWKLAAAKSS